MSQLPTVVVACLLVSLVMQLNPTPATAVEGPPWLELDLVADGFTEPVHVAQAADGSSPLVVAERAGLIRVVRDGRALDTPFLDISERVATETFEQGLFSVAFHPNYAQNGYVYVTSSPTPHEWRLERYQVLDDPDRLDPASATTLLSIDHPGDHHYGGQLQFGPDGYLWASVGDGGGAYGQYGDAQDLSILLGKLLRIDVDGGTPYAVPPDNPFVDMDGARGEIWAYGLRNPWRFSFDELSGDLYIGDVGETSFEEINVEPAGSGGGRNYGWPIVEGNACTPIAAGCDPSLYTAPVLAYGRDQGCSVTGGYVDRTSPDSPTWGTYVFSDFCTGSVLTLDGDGGTWRAEPRLPTVLHVSSFGEDAAGNLLLVDFSHGALYRVSSTTETPAPLIHRVELDVSLEGAVAGTLSVRGWNFMPDAEVSIAGVPAPTTYVDSTSLTVALDAIADREPGSVDMQVVNGTTPSSPFPYDLTGSIDTRRAFFARWAWTDQPVSTLEVDRTWMWGPEPFTGELTERYDESDGGARTVLYYDKARMEVTDTGRDPGDLWYVTNGLLTLELTTGRMQVGDQTFEERSPAQINVAGDPDDPVGPTYATFGGLLDMPAVPDGATIVQRVDRDGNVSDDPSLVTHGATTAHRVTVPGIDHQVASPFWAFMNATGPVYAGGTTIEGSLFTNPFYATGYPISEAYWTTVRVGGTPADVLVQCFERRCLTWTPGNPEGWQVEAGNVGRHYHQWRYGGE